MKKKRSTNRQLMGLGLGAIMSLGGPPVSLAEDSSGFVEKMKKWQSEMSEKFRDTYKSLRGESQKREKSGKSRPYSAALDKELIGIWDCSHPIRRYRRTSEIIRSGASGRTIAIVTSDLISFSSIASPLGSTSTWCG